MGDYSGTVPSILPSDVPSGDDWTAIQNYLTALSSAWTSPAWSPTYTNLTISNGTVVAWYRRVGKTVDYYWQFVLGSSSAVGTVPKLTLPVAPHASYSTGGNAAFPGHVHLLDTGLADRQGIVKIDTGSTIQLAYWNATPANANITATAPWTWGTGDMITIWGTYQAA